LAAVTVVVLGCDLASKLWAVASLQGEPSITVIPGVLDLTFLRNPGAAFGMGTGYTAVLSIVAAGIAVAVASMAHKVRDRTWAVAFGLLLAGARADAVRGVVLADGPGLSGGPSVPTSQPVFSFDVVDTPPDPYALAELGRDLRPPDYATTFARLAVQGSGLDEPISVAARFRPAWLRAVVDEPGVTEAGSVADAIRAYQG